MIILKYSLKAYDNVQFPKMIFLKLSQIWNIREFPQSNKKHLQKNTANSTFSTKY